MTLDAAMQNSNLKQQKVRWEQEVIGLVAAGGRATRISPLPCSKELYPIGFRAVDEGRSLRPKVACHYLLEKMSSAGITKVYIILREGKWDIPTYLGDGSMFDMSFAYLMMGLPYGTPFTLDQAYPFAQDALVAFGFPDIIFSPDDAFVQLLDCQKLTNSDVVLGLFYAEKPEDVDMVEVDRDFCVRSLSIKPLQTHLKHTWVIGIWTSVFTSFMHNYLSDLQIGWEHSSIQWSEKQELSMGHVLKSALAAGLKVRGVLFPRGTYLDIGTPDNLVKAGHQR